MVDENSIPSTTIYPSKEHADKVYEKNLRVWRELLNKYRYSMAVIVEYDVSIYAEAVGKGQSRKKKLRTEVNFLTAAISFCTKYVNCSGGEDFMAMHSHSLKAVFAVACTFRAMVLSHMRTGISLVGDMDTMGEEGDRRSIDTLVYGLVPTTVKARQKVIGNVLSMTRRQYTELNISSGGNGESEEGGDEGAVGQPEMEESEESDLEVDEDMLAMQNMDFNEEI